MKTGLTGRLKVMCEYTLKNTFTNKLNNLLCLWSVKEEKKLAK